ncbi:hypothetical protein [Acinetobacter baumannii]|uniref:hypothetical protein n=1 Tax=Acinetobacter baumannii TaxID=470 RepID=UPI003879323C
MKLFIATLFLILFPINVFAKTGYENVLTFNQDGWSLQKTPTGFALACTACDNQVMISVDMVPINKNNQQVKSNETFVNSLAKEKDKVAESFAKESVMGGKVKVLRADKVKTGGKDSFRYMFLADMGVSGKTFDNTSMLVHKHKIIKITLNYFDGYFSVKDKKQVNKFYSSLKFTP